MSATATAAGYTYTPQPVATIMSGQVADTLVALMRATVLEGTATSANIDAAAVSGKTGTAEYTDNGEIRNHSWFVGYSQDPEHLLAIAVILEGAGYATPMVGKVLEPAINLGIRPAKTGAEERTFILGTRAAKSETNPAGQDAPLTARCRCLYLQFLADAHSRQVGSAAAGGTNRMQSSSYVQIEEPRDWKRATVLYGLVESSRPLTESVCFGMQQVCCFVKRVAKRMMRCTKPKCAGSRGVTCFFLSVQGGVHMDHASKLPQNGWEGVLFVSIICLISVNIIGPLIACFEAGFSLAVWARCLQVIPWIFLCSVVLVFLTRRPAGELAALFKSETDSFNGQLIFDLLCGVLLMSVLMTLIGPMFGKREISYEPFERFFYRWPRNFALTLAVEAFIAQPIARLIMLRIHQHKNKPLP